MDIENGELKILQEGKVAKFVDAVDQISFSGKRAIRQGQNATYVTGRCGIKLMDSGLMATEIARGLDLQRDVLDQAATPLAVWDDLKTMDAGLFAPQLLGLTLEPAK